MAGAGLKVLVADGDDPFYGRLSGMLAEVTAGSISTDRATSVDDTLGRLAHSRYDICLLSHRLMPGDGIDVLRNPQTQGIHTAFVLLAEQKRKELCYVALQNGAMDYLIKDELDSFSLMKSMAFSLYRKQKELELQIVALRDSLTGLGNRALFTEQAEILMRLAERGNAGLGVLFMDIDGFKPVNDRHGHAVGDKLLQGISTRISERLRKGDIVARWGGDEFTALLAGVVSRNSVQVVAETLAQAVTMPYSIDGHDIRIGLSYGTALFPEDSSDINDLVRMADHRMYEAKSAKKAGLAGSRMTW